MTTFTCLTAALLALLTIPILLLWRASLTPQQHAKRMRGYGWTYKSIGARLRVSPTTARKWALCP